MRLALLLLIGSGEEEEEESNLFIPASKGKRGCNREWDFHSRFWTKENATKEAKSLLPWNKKKDVQQQRYVNDGSRADCVCLGVYTWVCTEHVNCPVLVQRVLQHDDQGTPFYVVNLGRGEHARELAHPKEVTSASLPCLFFTFCFDYDSDMCFRVKVESHQNGKPRWTTSYLEL